MPFASPATPSLGLTQIKHIVDRRFAGKVRTDVSYVNHDAAVMIDDIPFYKYAATNHGFRTGLGDWLFRTVAFPDAPDNAAEYLDLYHADGSEISQTIRRVVKKKRPLLDRFLEDTIEKYKLTTADIVGLSSVFSQTTASLALARKLKELKPDITVVMGGASCVHEPGLELLRNCECLDYVFSGPALVTFPEFVSHHIGGDLSACDCIDGVFSKNNLSRWRLSDRERQLLPVIPSEAERSRGIPGIGDHAGGDRSSREPSTPLRFARDDSAVFGVSDPSFLGSKTPAETTDQEGDSSPLQPFGPDLDINQNLRLDYTPYLDAFEEAFPNGEWEHRLLFETSRGCWWGEHARCSFCGLNGPDMCFHAMTPENAFDQIQWMLKYSSRCKVFASVDNILSRDYLTDVFPRLLPPPDSKLQYQVRAEFTEEEIDTLCRAGVALIQPGLEALSTATLKLMHKGTSAFSNIRFLKRCGKFPVFLGWNLLVAVPGEDPSTYEKYREDIPRLTHLPPPFAVYPIEYVRFTDYFENPARHGLELRPEPFYYLTYPFDEDAIPRLAHRFTDANCDAESIVYWLDALNESVRLWNARWYSHDGREQARLRLVEDERLVYDSRSGEAGEHPLSETALKLLRVLEEPHTAENLATALPGVPEADIAEAFAHLKERDLLFEETGRYMSLVC